MKGYRIQLIRHGITDANLNGQYIGITDPHLCAQGVKEIYEKVEKFYYPPVQKIYCSPLKRCVETASLIYPNAYSRLVPEIREMNFGEFEGRKADELMNREDYKQFLKGGLDNPPPKGESMRQVVQRCYEGIDFIIKDMMKEGFDSVAVVTHGGIIMNMLSCFGVPKINPMELACDFAEGYEIMVTAQSWQLSNVFEISGKFPYERIDGVEAEDDDV